MSKYRTPNGPVVEIIDTHPKGLCLIPNRVKINGEEMLVAEDGLDLLMQDGVIMVRLTLMPSKLICSGEDATVRPQAAVDLAYLKAKENAQGGEPTAQQIYESLSRIVAAQQ